MHRQPSDFRRGQVCSCGECSEWGHPVRKPQLGQNGAPIAWRGRWYHRMRTGHFRHSKGELLHRAIWVAHNGAIPDGLHVHHRNGDPGDNRIENLELLSPADHYARHDPRGWHGDDRLRGGGKKSWEKREWFPAVCQKCGAEFSTPYPTRARFCSQTCGREHRSDSRIRAKQCAHCGSQFFAKDPRKIYCSSPCNDAAYYSRKRLQPKS